MILVALMLPALAGCHTFQPVDRGELAPGQTVRVRVTGGYADSLGVLLQRDDARVVEGVIVEEDDASMMLDVAVSSELQGMTFESFNQRIDVPSEETVEVELRELDKRRTIAVSTLAAVAIGGIIARQLTADGGGAQLPGTGGPQDAVVSVPLLQIPFSILGWISPRR